MPGARGRDEDARTGRRRAERHVDRAELALGLDEDAAQLGHPARHPLEQLGLGRDRVAEVGVAAGLDRGLGHRLVALHQDRRTGRRCVERHDQATLRSGVDGEHRVGADPGAQGAARAGRRVGQPDGVVAERVDDRLVEGEDVLGADVDAQPAALAAIGGDIQRRECPAWTTTPTATRRCGDRCDHLAHPAVSRSGRERVQAIDQLRRIECARGLDIHQPVRPPEDRHILTLERESSRTRAEDHHSLAVADGPYDECQEGRFGLGRG